MPTAKITAKGQITIPKEVRDALRLRLGDQVVFTVEDGKAVLHPARRRSLSDLYGVFHGRAPFRGREAEREAARSLAVKNATGATEP